MISSVDVYFHSYLVWLVLPHLAPCFGMLDAWLILVRVDLYAFNWHVLIDKAFLPIRVLINQRCRNS
jgi:hypothetical protein